MHVGRTAVASCVSTTSPSRYFYVAGSRVSGRFIVLGSVLHTYHIHTGKPRKISDGLAFIPLYDRDGTTQLVFETTSDDLATAWPVFPTLNAQDVICIKGSVRARPADTVKTVGLSVGSYESQSD